MPVLGVVASSGGFLPSTRDPSSARLGDGMGPAALRFFRAPVDVLLCPGSKLWFPDRVLDGSFDGGGTEV
ncbi:unnamed protein product [Sphagnum jensenii]|uniref:Uncharacterized protein n=1 Tax=Sphagnum jensenii TaxID=128206 RepID=A0ABP1A5E9_9BRYO